MNAQGLRRYVDDLLRGRRPKPYRLDDFEAAQIRAAIDLRAARPGADAPRQEFLTDLHRRLAAQMEGDQPPAAKVSWLRASRRQMMVGLSAAAAAAVAAGSADCPPFPGGDAPAAGRPGGARGGPGPPQGPRRPAGAESAWGA